MESETKTTDFETSTLKTPTGEHFLTIRAYITGRDKRAFRKRLMVLSDGKNFNERTMEEKIQALDEEDDQLIQLIIVSLDGSTENILERVLDLKGTDYEFVLGQVKAVYESIPKVS